MSGKLDQSLDDIVKTRRSTAPRRNTRSRVVRNARTGGVTKVTKATNTSTKAAKPNVVVAAAPASGNSKIIVTGLPSDVTEQQIKDYFSKTIGPVKKVLLTYGPTGVSRGVATIIFANPNSAQEAATQLNGVKVDNRAMKIEVVVGANQAPALVPAKALGERIAQNKAVNKAAAKAKNQPRSAAAAPAATNGKTAGGRAAKRAPRGRNAGRPKQKSAAELDAEMTDYFGGGAASGTAVNGTAVAAGGDTGMDDEIM